MAYNEKLAARIREILAGKKNLTEKKMFGGIAFMLNEKMCVGVYKDDLILRCDPDTGESLLSTKGVRPFDITGKPMKGWLLIGPEKTNSKADLEAWIRIGVDENKKMKTAKKK